jgi:hypothetical protein
MKDDKPVPVSSDVQECAKGIISDFLGDALYGKVIDWNGDIDVAAQRIQTLLSQREVKDREAVARWMIENSLATGHGDTLEDLLKEASWQIKELRALASDSVKEKP